MRLEHVATRTWLLGAFAGWALLAWILALAGMGGHVSLLPADPALLQELPQPRPSPPDRVGPLPQYAEIGTRPLFSDDRRPKPFVIQQEGTTEPVNQFDYVLSSVLLTPGTKLAIVQPTSGGKSVSVHLGESADELPGWRLVELEPRSAVFEGPAGRKTLDLRVWDGRGGEAPTRMDAVTDADEPVPAEQPPPVLPPPPGPATAPVAGAGPTPSKEEEEKRARQQMDDIRKRIEQRRAQLREDALREQNQQNKR